MADGEPPSPNGRDDEATQAEYSWEDVSPATAVLETVATANNEDSRTISPLYETLDPDALDQVIRSAAASGCLATVSFAFEANQVTVDSTGQITVRPV